MCFLLQIVIHFDLLFSEDAFKINLYPILNEEDLPELVEEKEGAHFMVDLIKSQDEKAIPHFFSASSTIFS